MDPACDPQTLAVLLRVPQSEASFRAGVSSNYFRVLARDPRHRRRCLIAVLEAALDAARVEEAVAGPVRTRSSYEAEESA